MKNALLLFFVLLPTVVFAEVKAAQKYMIANIKVKDINSIGKSQESEKSILLDTQSGQVWLFISGKKVDKIRLVPIEVDGSYSKDKGKPNGGN